MMSCCRLPRSARGWRRAPLLAAALAAALSAGPAAATTLAQETPRAEARRAAVHEEFARLFDAVVDTVNREFWDKEQLGRVRWAERAAEARAGVAEAPDLETAARRINALLAELKTSHTVLLTPEDADYYVLRDVYTRVSRGDAAKKPRTQVAGIGIFTVRAGERVFTDQVLEGSPADAAGIKPGDEIVSVDGAPFHAVRSFRGKAGEKAQVAIRRTDGGPVETLGVEVDNMQPLAAFRAATVASARVIERDGRRVGYVHVWASVGRDSAKAFTDALEKLKIERGTAHGDKPVEALIVDMRGRIGGTGSAGAGYLEALDPRGSRVRSLNKKSEPDTSRPLRGRTAVLIDRHTRSAAEIFVHAYKRERQGALVGERTAGAVAAGRGFTMPGGNLLNLAVVGLEVDGDILEGPGVKPDIPVARPLPYSGGADPVLEAAIGHLLDLDRPAAAAPQQSPASGSQ